MRSILIVAFVSLVFATTSISSTSISSTSSVAQKKVKAQYGLTPTTPNGTAPDVDALLNMLNETNANSFNVLLYSTTGQEYLNLVQLLLALKRRAISSSAISIWVTLIPPSETRSGRCSIAADSPLTPFNETSFFDTSKGPKGCNDYLAWAVVFQKLRLVMGFDNLQYINIDDFVDNLHVFNAEYAGEIKSRLNKGNVLFTPTFYHGHGDGQSPGFILNRAPWLTKVVDGMLTYFRGERIGLNTCKDGCAEAPPAACGVSCLWGVCAERSLSSLGLEINDYVEAVKGLPIAENIFVGLYFSPYHSCDPGPSVLYDFTALFTAIRAPSIKGTMVYTTHAVPSSGCKPGDELTEKGCAVKTVYSA